MDFREDFDTLPKEVWKTLSAAGVITIGTPEEKSIIAAVKDFDNMMMQRSGAKRLGLQFHLRR